VWPGHQLSVCVRLAICASDRYLSCAAEEDLHAARLADAIRFAPNDWRTSSCVAQAGRGTPWPIQERARGPNVTSTLGFVVLCHDRVSRCRNAVRPQRPPRPQPSLYG
jgi:hypothetical protein